MMLLRARLIIIAVIAAWVGWVILNQRFGHCYGPMRANCVVDGDSF